MKFEFSDAMVQAIANQLAEGPFKVVAPLLGEIQRQVNAQQDGAINGGKPILPDAPPLDANKNNGEIKHGDGRMNS